ncbi:hypothetical protein Taro_028240, partial [Colocasia esculenta]|nr:hypothetical protein [Colocasia esculenta]
VATALVVAFLLPLFWVVICMHAACRMLGGHADVDSGKAMASYVAFSSRCRATSRGAAAGLSRAIWRYGVDFGALSPPVTLALEILVLVPSDGSLVTMGSLPVRPAAEAMVCLTDDLCISIIDGEWIYTSSIRAKYVHSHL